MARYIAEKEAAEAEEAEKAGRPPAPPWRPDPDDFTLMHEILAQIRDGVAETATLIADLPTPVKQRTKPPAAFGRPETLLDKERRRIREERDQAADDRLLDITSAAKRRWREQQAANSGASD